MSNISGTADERI